MLFLKLAGNPDPVVCPSGYPTALWLNTIEEMRNKTVERADNLEDGRHTTWFRYNGHFISVEGSLPSEDTAIALIDKGITDAAFVKNIFGETVASHFKTWLQTNPKT